MSFRLEVIITQIFELFGSILLKDTGVSKQLDDIDKKGSQTSKSMGLSFGSIASAALKLGAALGVGLGIKEMITTAAAGQEKLAQMDAVLKSTGGSAGMTKSALIDLADGLSKTTTFSKGTTEAGENLLLTFTGIGKKTFPDTIKAAQNMSQAMGTDLNSSIMLLGKSMNNPIEGMGRLAKSGVTFTAQQKEQITTMQKAGDTAGAQGIILAELSKEFGGSADAAGKTFNGQVTILKNGLLGMGASIGSTVIPYLTQFATSINNNMPKIKQVLTDMINAIVPKFQEWIKLIGEIVKEILPSFSTGVGTVKDKMGLFKTILEDITKALQFVKDNMNTIKPIIEGVGLAFLAFKSVTGIMDGVRNAQKLWGDATTIWSAITKGATGVQKAFNSAMEDNPVGMVILGITLLVAGLVTLFNKNKTFHDFVVNSWAVIKQVVGGAITAVIKFFKDLGTGIEETWTSIKTGVDNFTQAIVNFFKGLGTSISDIWNAIKQVFTDVVTAIVTFVNDKFGWLIDGVKTIFNALKDFFTTVWDAIKTVFLGVILLILDLVTGNFTKLKEDAKAIFNKLKDDFKQIWDDIKTIFNTVIKVIVDFCKLEWDGLVTIAKTIFNGLKDFLKTLWDSIKTTATTAWTSLKTAVINLCKDIIQGAKDLWNGLLDWFRELPGKLKTIGTDMINGLKDGINSVIGTVKDAVVTGVTTAIDWLKALPAQALTWGSDFIQGFVDGIMSKANALLKSVENIANSIRGFLHFSTPDYGPLADYETWMPDFMNGMAKGIDNNKFKVIDSIKRLTGDMKVNASIIGGVTANKQDASTSEGDSKGKGDIYLTINSPTAVSPSAAARELRQLQRELALG